MKKKNMGNMIKKGLQTVLTSNYFVLIIIVFIFLVFVPILPVLTNINNLTDMLSNIWPLLAIAIGQTVVFIIAGIDLSQTSIMAFTSVVGALLITKEADTLLLGSSPAWGWLVTENGGALGSGFAAVLVAMLVMIVLGALIGLLNGVIIAKLKMPAFMVTLVTQLFFRAFAILLTHSHNVPKLPQSFNNIANGGFGVITYSMIITVVLLVAMFLILRNTVFGKWVYSVGENKSTARVSGVPVNKVIILTYVISGLCAGVASILYSARLQMGRPTLGSSMLMDIIGATIIGGTSMYGGKGKVIWTLFGVMFFVLLSNILSLLNLSYFIINIVKGGFILLAALLDVSRTRLRMKQY